jgi:phosphate-selective porin OprO and OprP
MKKVGVLFLVITFLLSISALPALAADSSSELDQLKGEVKKLLNRIQDLEKKQKESDQKFESVKETAAKLEQEEAKLKEEKKTRAIAYFKDGFFIETPDNKFKLQMGGTLNFDTRVFESGKSPSSFDIRRARYDMRGNMTYGGIEQVFRLQLEMADSTPAVRNAYWIFKFMPELNLQVGQFKIPAGGADFLTEEAHVNFVEYSTDTPISPHFDRGFNIISSFMGGKIQSCIGMFTGTGTDYDNAQGDWDNDKNYALRLMLVPFKDSENVYIKGLHLAGSFEDGLQSNKTVRGEANNRTENFESNWYRWIASRVDLEERRRYGGELHWIIGAFTASYEFNRVEWDNLTVYNSSGKVVNHLDDTYHSDVHQIWLSYFLTGEQKSIEDVFFNWRQPKPKKNFSIKDGTWGAWEVIAKYALHDTSEDLFDGGANAILDGVNKGYSVTGGVRWTWNPRTRIMLDVNYLKSDEGKGITVNRNDQGAGVREYKDTETGLLMRLILSI